MPVQHVPSFSAGDAKRRAEGAASALKLESVVPHYVDVRVLAPTMIVQKTKPSLPKKGENETVSSRPALPALQVAKE